MLKNYIQKIRISWQMAHRGLALLAVCSLCAAPLDTVYAEMNTVTTPGDLSEVRILPAVPNANSGHTFSLGNTSVDIANKQPVTLPGPVANLAPLPMNTAAVTPPATPEISIPFAEMPDESGRAEQVAMTAQAPRPQGGPITPSPTAKVLEANEDTLRPDPVSFQLSKMQQEIDDLKKGLKKKQDTPDPTRRFVNKVGGLFMLDTLMVDQDADNKAIYGDAQNQIEFQEVRISLTGQGYGRLSYDCTFGFNDGVNFKNLVMKIDEVALLDEVRLGYFKVETGMNLAEGAFARPFLTTNSDTKTFRINRRIGAGSAHYFADEQLRIFGGIFCGNELNASDWAAVSNDLSGIILNGRVTGLPIYCEDEDGHICNVLHLGGSFTWVNPNSGRDNTAKLRARPTGWCSDMPYMLNGTLPLDDRTYSITGLEAAWQKNQFAIQSEAFIGSYEDYSSAWGYNIMGRVFLTPCAYRTYDKHKGCFGSARVPKNFIVVDRDGCRFFEGWGALELLAQYTKMDLENLRLTNNPDQKTHYRYGCYDEFMVGVNWFWNPQTVFMLNWIHSETDSAMIGTTEKVSSENDTFAMQLRFRF